MNLLPTAWAQEMFLHRVKIPIAVVRSGSSAAVTVTVIVARSGV